MKRYNILCVSFLLAMGITTSAYAQDDYNDGLSVEVKKPASKKKLYNGPTMVVKGRVVDATNGMPVSGIHVQTLNDLRFAAMTDEKGEFSVEVPTFATSLYVYGPQFLSQQVAIGRNDGTLKIKVLSDKYRNMYDNGTNILAASEAIVNATTSQTVETDIASSLGADVRSISRNGGPGYGAAMFIRGLNTLNSNAQPLIVVDGVIRDMQPTRGSLHTGDYTNLMLNINPSDVEKVTVLKNATAIYGAKGANGVILITTKRGHSMATRIDANIGVGFVTLPKLPDMMNANQYRLYASEMLSSHPDYATLTGTSLKFLNEDQSKYYYNTSHNNTDWTDEVYNTALTQNYSINVQGGDDVGMYNLSLGYTDANSTAKKNGFTRLNVRFNTDINIIQNLTTKFDLSFAKIDRNVFDNGAPVDFTSAPVASPTFLALIKSPILNPYTYNNVTGRLSSTLAGPDDFLTELDETLTLGNPTALLENGFGINKNRVEMTQFNAVIAPSYQFTPNLKLTETFSYSLDRISQRYYRPTGGMPEFLINGLGSVQNLAKSMFSKETSVESNTRLQFTKQFGAHFLDVFGGFRFTSFAYDDNEASGSFASAANDKMPNISDAMDYKDATGIDEAWKNLAWYANADYNYRNRYFAQVSMALESSSRFGKNSDGLSLGGVKWGFFPSVQAGWAISNESWFPKTNLVNYLMIKAGYDISGNDDINSYAARTSFNVQKYMYRSITAILNNIGNDKITYEKVGKFNVGLKSYLLDNRLGINFDFYKSHTSNLLTLKSFDNPVAGINNYWSNGGSLDNTGVELSLTGKPVVTKDFNLELGASLGHYKNEVKTLPNTSTIAVNGGGINGKGNKAQGYLTSIYGTDNVATIVGEAAGVFYGYKTAGVFSTDAEAKAAGNGNYLYTNDETGAPQYYKAGDVHFVDLNGDGIINENDKTIIGNPNPDLYGNLFATASYKNFTLSVVFNYSLGNDVYNYQRSVLEGESNFYNQTTAVLNRWKNEGDVTSMPRVCYGDPMGNGRFSDRWIEDGSYLRLKTLNLTYKVPVSLSWLQGLSVWAEANNLFTITKYLGSDPESSVSNSVLNQGIDAGNVALSPTFTFGVKFNL